MIIDKLSSLKNYTALHPNFSKAVEYINSLNFDNLNIGKIILDGDNVFASVSESKLKSTTEAKLEVHEKYIDIQIPVSKSESFGWTSRSNLKSEVAPYDNVKDIQFFKDSYTLQVDVKPDNFIIFFPDDAHAPCIGETGTTITKIVIKIKL